MQGIRIILLAAAVSFSGSAMAETLKGERLQEFVANKQVFLKTRYGEFPLFYSSNGRVTGDGSGLGLARFFAPKETGKWFVQGNRLCQKFPTWYKGKISCFTVSVTGERTFNWKRDDGFAGAARIAN